MPTYKLVTEDGTWLTDERLNTSGWRCASSCRTNPATDMNVPDAPATTPPLLPASPPVSRTDGLSVQSLRPSAPRAGRVLIRNPPTLIENPEHDSRNREIKTRVAHVATDSSSLARRAHRRRSRGVCLCRLGCEAGIKPDRRPLEIIVPTREAPRPGNSRACAEEAYGTWTADFSDGRYRIHNERSGATGTGTFTVIGDTFRSRTVTAVCDKSPSTCAVNAFRDRLTFTDEPGYPRCAWGVAPWVRVSP